MIGRRRNHFECKLLRNMEKELMTRLRHYSFVLLTEHEQDITIFPQSDVSHIYHIITAGGKSLLELWVTTFPPLIFVGFILYFLCMCSNNMVLWFWSKLDKDKGWLWVRKKVVPHDSKSNLPLFLGSPIPIYGKQQWFKCHNPWWLF